MQGAVLVDLVANCDREDKTIIYFNLRLKCGFPFE